MIALNFLQYRRDFFELNRFFFSKIKPQNKEKLFINFLVNRPDFKDLYDLNSMGIPYKIYILDTPNNYLQKLNIAFDSSCEYSIKYDEDCFVNNYILDYMIENTDILNNEDNILISPLLQNGIPTCELFAETFFDQNEINLLYSIFTNTYIPDNLWEVNYSALNYSKSLWNAETFYSAVEQINHYYKGIHPVRVNIDAQLLLLTYMLKYADKIVEKKEYSLTEINAPYFCNSMFIIKTKLWADIVNNKYIDGFDEVPINLYREQTKKKFMFIKNAHTIHTMYSTVYGDGMDVRNKEKIFYEKLINKIIG